MNCYKCDKKLGIFEKKKKVYIQGEETRGKIQQVVFCQRCYEDFIKNLESRKNCSKCVYCQILTDEIGFPSFYCSKIKQESSPDFTIYSYIHFPGLMETLAGAMADFPPAAKVIVERTYLFDAEKCVHFITPKDYREKALRGEIVKPEVYFVICPYCGTRYDATKHNKCPECGASYNP